LQGKSATAVGVSGQLEEEIGREIGKVIGRVRQGKLAC
jgi:hypothetical protein